MEAYASEGLADGVHVLVASEVRLYREGLEQMLRAAPGIRVAGGALSATETLDRVQDARPSVVLLDMAMNGALAVARLIARQTRGTKVVALGMPEFETEVLSCVSVGVAGDLTRSASMSDILAKLGVHRRAEAMLLLRHESVQSD